MITTTILYVEDDEGLQSLVEHALVKLNIRLLSVTTLVEARKVFNEENIDIVLLDYELPDGTGIEFIQEYAKNVACIVLTGVGSESLAVKCMNQGAKDYIVKDVQGQYLEVLPSVINQVIHEIKLEEDNRNQAQKLLKIQERLQGIFDHTPDLMIIVDAAFKIIDVSKITVKNYKKSKKQIQGLLLSDIIGIKSVEQLKKNQNTSIKTNLYSDIPVLVKCVDLSPGEYLIVFRSLEDHFQAQKAIEKLELIETTNIQLERKNKELEDTIRMQNDTTLLGQSEVMLALRKIIRSVAVTEATVMINGETGTGKELVANAIAGLSRRSKKPMITLNCASIPKDLVESELFGHEKGAFTGALKQYDGKFIQADGGTLFLDEIGELEINTQAKLLRALQEGEVQPVGSQKIRHIDVRVITATNRNLEDMVANGLFREDLFYRLNVIPISVPALRDRKDDIVLLAQFFLKKYEQLYSMNKNALSANDIQQLNTYPWPGNVRELQNVIERFLVLGHLSPLTPPDFFKDRMSINNFEHSISNIVTKKTFIDIKNTENVSDLSLSTAEKQHIKQVLISCDWVISGTAGAAKILNLNPSTLRFRMKKLNIIKK